MIWAHKPNVAMARVKIKHPDPGKPENRLKLVKTLSEHLVYATKIITTQDGYITLTRTDEDIDKIFKNGCNKKLTEQDFEPILPPEQRAKRTVILFNVDEYLISQKEKDIEEEILKENAWIKEGISNIFKVPRAKIIKICFNDSLTAKNATEKGLLAFHMSIPSHNIKIDEFIPILTCMRCYQLESHTTNNCPMPKEHKVCSECGGKTHTWRECKEATKKCLNCEGQHRTLAYKCPKRKEIIDKKRKETKTNMTYSQVTKNTANKANNNANIITETITDDILNKDTASKILTCIIHSHIINMANPGTYNTEINKVFKLNNLPHINLPENPPSKQVLSLATATESGAKLGEEQKGETYDSQEEEEEEEMSEVEIEEQQQSREIHEKTPQGEMISGTAIGLKIITKESNGWPEDNLYLKQILESIEKGIYKWTYTSSAYSEREIFNMLASKMIDLHKVFHIQEDQSFRKIRNGLIQEKTPPNKEQRKKRSHHNQN